MAVRSRRQQQGWEGVGCVARTGRPPQAQDARARLIPPSWAPLRRPPSRGGAQSIVRLRNWPSLHAECTTSTHASTHGSRCWRARSACQLHKSPKGHVAPRCVGMVVRSSIAAAAAAAAAPAPWRTQRHGHLPRRSATSTKRAWACAGTWCEGRTATGPACVLRMGGRRRAQAVGGAPRVRSALADFTAGPEMSTRACLARGRAQHWRREALVQ